LTTTGIRRRLRAPLAAVLAALVAAPATLVPAGAAARADVAALPSVATPDRTAPGAPPESEPEPELSPSIHYRDELAHAGDVLAFEPGERVSIPFAPRGGDTWEVDGRAPRALPPGNATGHQMRDAAQGSTWATGLPADVAAPDHFDRDAFADIPGDGSSVDQPTAGDVAAVDPASTVLAPSDEVSSAAPISADGLRREVFGFLPYWEVADSTTVLDWRTLSTVAYFSVGCAPGGNLLKRDADGSLSTGWAGWTSSKMTSIIDAAHRNQTRVVLTITCFAWSTKGATTQAGILGSSTARNTLARQAAAAVRDRGADGINLDFEPIVAGYADEFTALVRAVRRELNAIAPGYQLTFDTLGYVGNQPIAEATAPGGADAVFIMGYDYRTASASSTGSISPLTGPVYDLTDTVKAYTAKVAPSKLILGVPYYGRAWSTPTDDLHAKNISGAKYGAVASPPYAQAVDLVAAYGRRYDSVEQAPWTAYRRQTCTEQYGCVTAWRQLYYDDGASLRLRYDLVNRSSLRGAGIWALGYDNTRTELRQALADKFRVDRTPPVAGITTLPQRVRSEGFTVSWTAYDDSTVRSYDVQLSVNGGSWAAWLTGTGATSSVFLGRDGQAYAFRVRATDVHGNVSAWRALPLGSLRAPAELTVGGWGAVVTDGLRLRAAPTTDASVMTTFSEGDALQIIGGPSQADGYTWFQVAGPVRQWSAVDPLQVGGWVAAFGGGVTNVTPRAPVYATTVAAGIVGLRLANGGLRSITPNGDGVQDALRIDWTNTRPFDAMSLRIYRLDGSLVGDVSVPDVAAGAATFWWNGRVDGMVVPNGAYVVQLHALDGAIAYTAPSPDPVTAYQITRFGVMVGSMPSTSVAFGPPMTPTRSTTLTYNLTFGSAIRGFARADLTRGGTATGCTIGTPTGSGASWRVSVTGCSAGTVVLGLRPGSVTDPVGNVGPAQQLYAPRVLIDRTRPMISAVRTALRTGVSLQWSSTGTGVLAIVGWSAYDGGGAGIATYDVARSLDGGAFVSIASGLTARSLPVSLVQGHIYRFEVRARDQAGNVGRWLAGPTIRGRLVQQNAKSVIYGGTWQQSTYSYLSGGSSRYATTRGSSASYTFTGRGFAWVATTGPSRGVARIYVDGTLAATIDTRADDLTYRAVVYARNWTSVGTHTVRIVVLGTAGRPHVDVDAFEILR
jgi:spore germination protein YaaH